MITLSSVQIRNNIVGAAAGYTVTEASGTVCFVPSDPMNADYQQVQVWIATGNTPLPAS